MRNTIEEHEIQDAEQILFQEWLRNEVFSDTVAETVNEQELLECLLDAKKERSGIVGLAVGCQQFSEVSGDNGTAVNIVKELDTSENSRVDRFAEGIASLQQSLRTWGVSLEFFLTLSDIEGKAFVHNHKGEGMFEESKIQKIMNENLDSMKETVSKHGGRIEMFSHFEVLKSKLGVDSFIDLLSRMDFTNGEIPTEIDIQTMLWEFYEIDPVFLTEWVRSKTDKPIVWFDLMSPLAGEHRKKLQGEIKTNHPDMPIVSLLRNSGKWETPPDSHRTFRSKQQFVSDILGIVANTQDKSSWITELMSKDDRAIEAFLHRIGLEVFISSLSNKNDAIGILERITFGEQSMKREGLEIEEVLLPSEINMKSFLADKLNKTRGHIFNLIKNGSVKINGTQISGIVVNMNHGDLIEVGKKTKFKVCIDDN